ncbi:hypothetical protein M378DRAFT_171218 [Amanita muscaria Koide BX008]|uniref:Uncharacterized protein n=1 Tax=Amanita muscaria (strain Koide BX008) TaxID=946122 RepID=A0A0C2W9M2_AMAMK|nr:hypothetical protein M378DRAFT_171218 [Amanita muscaria Koide BX008]
MTVVLYREVIWWRALEYKLNKNSLLKWPFEKTASSLLSILYGALRTSKLCWKVLRENLRSFPEQILACLFPHRHDFAQYPTFGSVCEGIKENELS